LKLPSWLRR